MNISKIEKLVDEILIAYQINVAPIDVFDLAQKLEITINRQVLGNNISGAFLSDADGHIISINATENETRQRFSVAHELGHYFLHRSRSNLFVDSETIVLFRESGSPKSNDIEKEANVFAANLLMPKKFLQEELDQIFINNKTDSETLITLLANRFNVSQIAMTYRLTNLNFLR